MFCQFYPAIEVTDDMCVTHFLIQPDPEGVKLQGWNEPAFSKIINYIFMCIHVHVYKDHA